MFAAHPGDVVFSKIDGAKGAVTVLPPEVGSAVVTPEFPVFTPIPERLDGDFARLVVRTGGFLDALRQKASGTSGRKRVSAEAFASLSVPLPSLAAQLAIVATYRAELARAAELDVAATSAAASAAQVFEAALGLAPPPPLPDRPMLVARFRDMDRWSHEGVLRRQADSAATVAPTWPVVRLGDVVAGLENGWSPQCLDRPALPGEWGVLKVSAVSSGTYREDENKALPATLAARPRLRVQAGDVLITRGSGVARLVGVAAHVETTRDLLMMCDLIFRVVFGSASQLNPAFLAAVLKTRELREQITAKRTGASPGMQKITSAALLALAFPLPPLLEQVAMVEALAQTRTRAVALRAEAASARAAAWSAFEAAVYAPADPALAPGPACEFTVTA